MNTDNMQNYLEVPLEGILLGNSFSFVLGLDSAISLDPIKLQNVTIFKVDGEREKLAELILSSFLLFLSQRGVAFLFNFDLAEIENFSRTQNHLELVKKQDFEALTLFIEQLKVTLEVLFSKALAENFNMTNLSSSHIGSSQLELLKEVKTFVTKMNINLGECGITLQLLDVDTVNQKVFFRLELEGKNWELAGSDSLHTVNIFFKGVIEKSLGGHSELNGYDWVAKPWK